MWYSNGLVAQMNMKSFLNILLYHLVHSTQIVGIQRAFFFLRFPFFLCKFLRYLRLLYKFFLLGCLLSTTMGGSQNRTDPKSCGTMKDNKKVWELLEARGVTPYMES